MGRRWQSAHGGILIHTAVAMIALLAFMALAVDQGLLYTSRRQAQNAADAAALSGAIELSLRPGAWADARVMAAALGAANPIYGETPQISTDHSEANDPDPTITDDISFPICPPGSPGAGTDRCIRVNVYRQPGRQPLPTFFARLLGIDEQGIRATATAEAVAGNATDCLRPFAIPDKWLDLDDSHIFSEGDIYRSPDDENPTGYTVDGDLGTELLLHGDSKDPPRIDTGWFYLADITGGGGGTNELNYVIRGCIESRYGIGDDLPEKRGDSNGIKHGVADLIDLDPHAYYDPETKTIKDSCVEDRTCERYVDGGLTRVSDPTATYSPRIVPLPIFDPELQYRTGEIKIVNIIGFFIEPMPNGKDVLGVLMLKPDLWVSDKPMTQSFLRKIMLVR